MLLNSLLPAREPIGLFPQLQFALVIANQTGRRISSELLCPPRSFACQACGRTCPNCLRPAAFHAAAALSLSRPQRAWVLQPARRSRLDSDPRPPPPPFEPVRNVPLDCRPSQ